MKKTSRSAGRHWKQWIGAAVITPVLLGGFSEAPFAAPLSAQAEQAEGQSSSALSWSYSYAYEDQRTGTVLVNVYNNGESRILMRDAEGAWSKLPSRYTQVWNLPGSSAAAIIPTYMIARNEFDNLYFNFERQAIVSGGLYEWSPSQAYGIRKESPYTFPPNNFLLFKDQKSGVIRQMDVSPFDYRRLQWLKDGSFVTDRFNDAAQENEIVIGRPDTGTVKRLMLGTIRRINADAGLIAFVKNEPGRIWYIYNLSTGKERTLVSESEKLALFPEPVPSDDPKAAITLSLPDVDRLPEFKPAFEYANEAVLNINDQQYALPYAFIGGNSVYVPVRPLIDDLGLEVTTNKSPQGNSYTIQRATAAITIKSDEVHIYSDRLFINTGHLQKLGFHNPVVGWIN
ncbi:hypothetical protein [Paenibacillus spongiae]|uniref:Copper amine oxidase N-terminal domain-containing protein n=1 Tax=Paenibacillus spongiae TaxID=2909671 RepID=A0ABY5SBE6_9BACL|nr:hypothetical protein [Paenibacillus spongiae]UVI29850.1 hypothetical protein L1F29_31430 [Paenibacillus spongiae]